MVRMPARTPESQMIEIYKCHPYLWGNVARPMTEQPTKTTETPTRRQLLTGIGAIGASGLSGCLGDDPEQVFTADDVGIRTGDGIGAAVSEFKKGTRERVEFTTTVSVDEPGDYYLRGSALDDDGEEISYQDTTRRFVPGQNDTYQINLSDRGSIVSFLFDREPKAIAGIRFHAYRESVVEGDHFINEGGEGPQ